MRELTFRGFLTQYVKRLSEQETNSLSKLAAEAGRGNPRLCEPLVLYAVYSGKQNMLLQVTKDSAMYESFNLVVSRYDADALTVLFETESPALPAEYHKVWRSYLSQKNRPQTDSYTKELMRQKVKRLQEKYGATNYRIYTDLKLNPGNLNAWLKHGDGDKVSLETARMTLRYVESAGNMLQ